ncbi:MAG: hypothetical protein M1838_002350 [Thelocarpon superellum]|nr:MAG: hypothetical protein M1838_002350 [Thelocarpon superellum]
MVAAVGDHASNVRLPLTRVDAGSLIPVPPGRMRNDWYPKGLAEYLTPVERRDLRKQHVAVARDVTFQNPTFPVEVMVEQQKVVNLETALLSPHRAMLILTELVPSQLDFHRSPIASTPTTASPQDASSSHPESAGPTPADPSATAETTPEPASTAPTSIYGSVSTSDIATTLRAILAADRDGSRVVLSPEDISFRNPAGEEVDRVKTLGEFEVDIRVKGATEPLRRTIAVLASQ